MDTLIWPRWANDHDAAYLQTKTNPITRNLIWIESDPWLLSYSVRKSLVGWTDERMDGRKDREHSIVPPFPSQRAGRGGEAEW